ncbi:hydrogenase expression/formation protein HypE [Actinophytocola xinjiangensis]|uniref:Hydrogenase expression/formation protein HypE n=1 Tax=Actinophytocola xinjiangensis TaxID=485602 RepID=A0A7Z0WLW6_9PSEU|nr:hydrogenase expression/formation protein HypE [Actinophytocola xinjiangensis]OLF10540.1 hydrogenase expression/formation protein HypE [Actinophytocola xinjiangensis]
MLNTTIADQEIVLDHGTGARLSRELVELTAELLGDVYVGEMEDSAIVRTAGEQLAITTDSFVVDPPLFGNGDIGKVAVCGTVNDLAVLGAEPRYLTLGVILETGLPLSRYATVLRSVGEAAREAGVVIVAGDTKVVRPGEADQIYLNTAGIGVFRRPPLRMAHVRAGDSILLTGPIGNHTVHLLSVREGLGFERDVLSDCAPLNGLIADVSRSPFGQAVHSIRDVTRGGLTAVMHEYARATGLTPHLVEEALPIERAVRMACDMLGINPMNAANEGCLCLFVQQAAADGVLEVLRGHPYGRQAVIVGTMVEGEGGEVRVTRPDGRVDLLDELQGAELPRLC